MSKKFKPFPISLLVIAVVLALLGTYFGLKKVSRERVLSRWREEAQVEVARNEAEKAVADETKKANDEAKKASVEAEKASDEAQRKRQEMASAKNQEKNKNGEWNRFFLGYDVTLADKTVPISDPKTGISFILPYRETWHIDPDHPLEPYASDGTGFSFDLVGRQYPGAGSFNWLFGLSIEPTGNYSVSNGKVIAPPEDGMINLKVITINGYQVIKGMTAGDGLCGSTPIVIVLGKQYDYFFYTDCVMSQSYELQFEENAYRYLETIIKTIKFAPGF